MVCCGNVCFYCCFYGGVPLCDFGVDVFWRVVLNNGIVWHVACYFFFKVIPVVF